MVNQPRFDATRGTRHDRRVTPSFISVNMRRDPFMSPTPLCPLFFASGPARAANARPSAARHARPDDARPLRSTRDRTRRAAPGRSRPACGGRTRRASACVRSWRTPARRVPLPDTAARHAALPRRWRQTAPRCCGVPTLLIQRDDRPPFPRRKGLHAACSGQRCAQPTQVMRGALQQNDHRSRSIPISRSCSVVGSNLRLTNPRGTKEAHLLR